MITINPYITFNGNCEAAFDFYKSVFGGAFENISRFGDMPPVEGQPPLAESDKNKIMHVSYPISKEIILMGSDTTSAYSHELIVGNNISLSINFASRAATDKIFNALAEGGKITMPLDETFWGAYFGMFTDKFGIHWMLNCDEK